MTLDTFRAYQASVHEKWTRPWEQKQFHFETIVHPMANSDGTSYFTEDHPCHCFQKKIKNKKQHHQQQLSQVLIFGAW
jgi:hypothetical protein